MATFGSQLEAVMTLQGPSMAVDESQIEVVAASSETKHGHP